VAPAYPAEARDKKITGVVILEASIGADGRVLDARVLRSIPGLDDAAVEAVRQWEFTPTLINGVPTAVTLTTTIQFSLQ
jgi:protein TonB